MNYAILWALIGFGLASWVIVRLTLPDPPPDRWAQFVKTSVAGIVGGVLGGAAAHGLLSSDPMPGIAGSSPMPGLVAGTFIGAAAGGLVLATVAALRRAPRVASR